MLVAVCLRPTVCKESVGVTATESRPYPSLVNVEPERHRATGGREVALDVIDDAVDPDHPGD